KTHAAGVPGVYHALKMSQQQMGVRRTALTLARLNQKKGFDCPGCAWPDPDHRSPFEFCENGAKAVAEEATLRRVDRDFFATHPLSELEHESDWFLGQQGRITEPFYKPAGHDHYRPIAWDEAFRLGAARLQALPTPDGASFYTSGRTSNEAAFLYQLLVRRFGTNNLPDCSNMCHESSGTGLSEVIGVGKGTVGLDDFERADAIFILGQNPGTNHPRMFTTLLAAKRRGCKIVSINPLRERSLVRFAHPQEVLRLFGEGTAISDLYLQLRIGGDVALLKGI